MIRTKALVETPLGAIGIGLEDGVLTSVDLEPDCRDETARQPPAALAGQLDAYFSDGAARFDLPMELRGTPFQRRVWEELRKIPAGTTVTYGELARKLGTSPRAVGGACRANPCPILVPCHRVVASGGLGGFAGDTSGRKLDVKRWLLRHEASRFV
jgi:methylated-DNA-[protein]-cysteine S-methyltransferase